MPSRCLYMVLVCFAASLSLADRPNILFIMTDDQAPWAVGAFDGPTHADTPHLNRLFEQGTYLPNTFVVTPVCSPSRAALATSRYGSEVGITDWLHPKTEANHGLAPQTTTWYEVLQNAGYHTGLVGKWHLGLLDQFHPTRTGFDYFMGHRGGGWSPSNPTLEKNGAGQKFEGLTTDILSDHAITSLKDR
ncbi:MAG: sulfatase-like hydrolase/transferase, partial [Fuerstiella sp.]|nr:sulfatase-like hydrolase/transferase [Fuerstiella sp.]